MFIFSLSIGSESNRLSRDCEKSSSGVGEQRRPAISSRCPSKIGRE
jgi:hypothetical protein